MVAGCAAGAVFQVTVPSLQELLVVRWKSPPFTEPFVVHSWSLAAVTGRPLVPFSENFSRIFWIGLLSTLMLVAAPKLAVARLC